VLALIKKMEFRRNSFKNIYSIILMLFWLTLGIGILFIAIKKNEMESIAIAIFLLAIVGLYILMGYAKIIINDSGIGYKSMFKNYFIEWSEVSSYGGFSVAGPIISKLKNDDLKKCNLLPKMIYVSKMGQMKFYGRHKLGKDFISFGYREKALNKIEEKLNKC
jgi:hypothetical protein